MCYPDVDGTAGVAQALIDAAARAEDARRARRSARRARAAARGAQLRPAAHRGLDPAAPPTSGWPGAPHARRRHDHAGGPEPIGTDPDGRLAVRPSRRGRRPAVVRARAIAAGAGRPVDGVRPADPARQSRQRQLLSDRSARPGGVRLADRSGPSARPGGRRADPAPASGRPARAGRRDRRHGGAQHQHRQGAAAPAHRHRLLLPARLRLDQSRSSTAATGG